MNITHLLTQLALPCGLIWLGIAAMSVLAWRARCRKVFRGLLALFVFYTLAGNVWVSIALNWYLERPYRNAGVSDHAHFDALVVLGGGSMDAPTGSAQLTRRGDRVMLAARLYQQNRTRFLVCTGEAFDKSPDAPRDPSETAKLLLVDVGVPADHIIRIGGRYTKEEIAKLRQLVQQRQWKRIGLITSAWHMNRALRLARGAGLELQPIAADFHSTVPRPSLVDVIPSSVALRNVDLAWKEILAGFVGR